MTLADAAEGLAEDDVDLLPGARPAIQPTLDRISELLADSEDYDDEFLRPTIVVAEYARDLLRKAASRTTCPWPLHHAAPLGDGDLLVQWGTAERCVALYVPVQAEKAVLAMYGPQLPPETSCEATPRALGTYMDWLGRA